MQPLTEQQIGGLLQPYLVDCAVPPDLYPRLTIYLELLLRWNARTNLTAIRDPAQLVQRQVGESLFAARLLKGSESLLDVGSGAGFPGIPLGLLLPGLHVTVAESQGKKASFLREAVRVLQLSATVWAGRIENMPSGAVFNAVAMRAVDKTEQVIGAAMTRVAQGGFLLRYAAKTESAAHVGWTIADDLTIPLSSGRLVMLRRESDVPRGTSEVV